MLSYLRLTIFGSHAQLGLLLLGTHIAECGFAASGDPARRALASRPSGLITALPLAWGTIPTERRSEVDWTIRNDSGQAVDVAKVETSCPCLVISPLPSRIEPGASRTLHVGFDPAVEPDFRGRLRIDLEGRAPDNRPLFRSYVDLMVAASAG